MRSNFLNTVEDIISILKRNNKIESVHQFANARLMGGTPGETFSIVCCLLKTIEISNAELFSLIAMEAKIIFLEAEILGYDIRANFDLFNELKS